MKKVSAFGLSLVKAFEGFYAKPYYCPAGVLTQGYGHTAMAGPPALGGVWSEKQASEILLATLEKKYAAPVRAMLKREPTQAQFDAMVSLAYNIGVGAFGRSSVLRHFNAGNHAQAAASFALWNKGGGKVLPGLVRRRASETLVYLGIKDLDFDGKLDPGEPRYAPSDDTDAPALKPVVATIPIPIPIPQPIPPAAPRGGFWSWLFKRSA